MIVVGVDGSEHASRALSWALDEARLRGSPVKVVLAWNPPAPPGVPGFYASSFQDPAPYREGAEGLVETIAAEAARAADGVEIAHEAIQGSPAEALVRAAEDAELLVVGSRGHGGFSSLLLGSVSQQCVQHAHCPVVVVRHDG